MRREKKGSSAGLAPKGKIEQKKGTNYPSRYSGDLATEGKIVQKAKTSYSSRYKG